MGSHAQDGMHVYHSTRPRPVGDGEILRQIAAAGGFAMRCAVAFAVAFAWNGRAHGQAPMLAEPALARRLHERVTLTWTDQQLAQGLARLGEVQGLPVWLDRRVDAGQEIDLAIDNEPVAAVLTRVTQSASGSLRNGELGWTTLRSVIYVGPAEAARELATLSELARQSIAKAPTEARRRWLTPAPWTFPRLSEPRVLLDEAVAAAGAKLRPGAEMPHDLWPERSLPAVAPIDRVVLLLAGFELTADMAADGRSLKAIPIKRPVQSSRTLAINPRVEAELAKLVAADDSIRVERQGRQATVFARWEELQQLRGAPRGNRPQAASKNPVPAATTQRFTLRIANKPVGPVLAQLGTQLKLTVAWDPTLTAASPAIEDTLISCEVQNADLDGLLAAILESAGLAFDRDGQNVTVRARP